MRCTALVITMLLIPFCSALRAAGGPSEWDSYCRKCHVGQPMNAPYDAGIKPHKNASLSCVGCHRDKGISGHVRNSARALRLLFENVTLPPDIRPSSPSSVTSADCLSCHSYILDVDEIDRRKLPREVRDMGLRASHRQHWDYRIFTDEERNRLNVLMARNPAALGKTDADERDRLLQIEKMQCSKCHERFKKGVPGGTDPNVSIAMKNPMECTACHIPLRQAVHPGEDAPLPSALACEACHHGKLHQKIIFFPVDRATEKDCLRCHPKYSPAALLAAKPAQFGHKSTQTSWSGNPKATSKFNFAHAE